MATHHHRISGKTVTEHEEVVLLEDDTTDLSWTHVTAPKPGEVEAALATVRTPELIVDILLDSTPHPEVLVSEGALGVVFPLQVPGSWTRSYLRFVVVGQTIVSITDDEIDYIEAFRRLSIANGSENSVNQLGGILESCGNADRDALRAMRSAVDDLEDLIEEQPSEVSITMVRKLKRSIVTCGNICEDQTFVLTSLEGPTVVAAVGAERAATRVNLLTLVRFVDRSFDRLDTRARELEHHLNSFYQKKTEDRLRILTVISAIFMPLTLVAGIYGMNFEHMPELGMTNAYFYCLAAMVLISLGMLGWFYAKGWLAPSAEDAR